MADQVQQIVETSETPDSSATKAARAGVLRRYRFGLVTLVVLLLGGWFGYGHWSIESGLKRGQKAVDRGKWKQSQEILSAYLRRNPDDAAAHLLIAESLIKDPHGGRDYVDRAIGHLRRITDDSPQAARARLQEARLTFLILRKPAQAERLLQQSLSLEPDSLETTLLMWRLLDATGRHIISREYFWKAFTLTDESGRPSLLRDWFLAEFDPEQANAEVHRAVGAVAKPSVSLNSWVRFRESEPEANFLHAAIAGYYLERGNPESSLELLKESTNLSEAMTDPFFVAVLFESLVDLGELEKARACFERFPEPHTDYLYWSSKGIFDHQVVGDAKSGIKSYKKALDKWPAKYDWSLMTKLSDALRKTGQIEEASAFQERVKRLTLEILTKENIGKLHAKLQNLQDPIVAGEVCDLYTELGLKEEAAAWSRHQQSLRSGKAADSR